MAAHPVGGLPLEVTDACLEVAGARGPASELEVAIDQVRSRRQLWKGCPRSRGDQIDRVWVANLHPLIALALDDYLPRSPPFRARGPEADVRTGGGALPP